MPGNALKLEEAQKKVSSHSSTKMQLGSGWKPGKMGFLMVLLPAQFEVAETHVIRNRTKQVRVLAILALSRLGTIATRWKHRAQRHPCSSRD
jgi:hypothetical protein